MSIPLPPAIALYLQAENSGDVAVLAECFVPTAVVRDEKRTHTGLAAIQQWKAETKAKYQHTVEPIGITERGGKSVVKARLAGSFPGSPIVLEFEFKLEAGKIAVLEIHS